MLDKNTPGKPQGRTESDFSDSQEVGAMSTTNATPPLPEGKERKTYYVKKDSKELSDKQFAVHRIADDARISELMTKPNADKECERLEKLTTGGGHVEPGDGKTKHSRRVTLTEARLQKDVEGMLGRELTPDEQDAIESQIIDSQRSDVSSLTKDEYQDCVMELAQHFKQEEAAEAAAAQAIADAANPPVERWTKEATELGTTLGARIWSFAAMHDVVEKVNHNFAALKDAIDAGNLPPSARIMPDYPWKKITKDGKHTTNEKGFLDFQDYCLVVLKRGKSAVYSMLKKGKMPREKGDPDNSLGAVIKRGAKTLTNLHKKLSDKDKKKVSFDIFMEQVVTAARAIMTAELAAKREEADQPAATTTAEVALKTLQAEVLPPSQGQAG